MQTTEGDATMLSIVDPDAYVLGTTPDHATWLGRDLTGVIGHSCREWCAPGNWETSWHMFRQAFQSGEAKCWERTVIRADDQLGISEIVARPIFTARRRRLMLCTNRVVFGRTIIEEAPRISAIDVAEYAEDILRDLARMASSHDLPQLGESLEIVAREAAAVAATRRLLRIT